MSTVTDWLAKQTVYTYDDAGRLKNNPKLNAVCWAFVAAGLSTFGNGLLATILGEKHPVRP